MQPYYIIAIRVNWEAKTIEGFFTRNEYTHITYNGMSYDEISTLEKCDRQSKAIKDDILYFSHQFEYPVTYLTNQGMFPDIFRQLSNMLSGDFSGEYHHRIDLGKTPCYDLGCSFIGDNGYCSLSACVKRGSITTDHTEPDVEFCESAATSIVCPNCHKTIGYLMKGEE